MMMSGGVDPGDPMGGAMAVTADYFHVLGIQPALGRGFVEGEDRPDAEPVAEVARIISSDFGDQP